MELVFRLIVIVYSILLSLFSLTKLNKFSPANVFTLFWTAQILFMVIGWANYLLFNYKGIIFILICLTSYTIGSFISRTSCQFGTSMVVIDIARLKKVFCFMFLLSMYSALRVVFQHGFSMSSMMNINELAVVSNEISVERYSGESSGGGIVGRILAMNDYACPMIGGYLYYLLSRHKWISYISILPMLISGMVNGAKMGIITGGFLWIIGLVICAQTFSYKINLNLSKIIRILFVALGFFGVLLLTMMMRIGSVNMDTFNVVTGKFTAYFFGHLPAFDIWFANNSVPLEQLTFGGKTFFGITNTLGILERKQGVFETMVLVSNNADYTNVYTVFRMFVEDFGKIGTPIFLLIIGILTNNIFINFTQKSRIVVNSVLLFMMYFFISWSFVTSVLAYGTYIIMPFYIFAILRYSRLRVLSSFDIKTSVS